MKNLQDTLNESLINEGFWKEIPIPHTNHCIIYTDKSADTVNVYGFRNMDDLVHSTMTDYEFWQGLENHLKPGEVCYMDTVKGTSWNDNPGGYFHAMITVIN